ncbi:hypothetical protein OROHE_001143 [Orobanche hederae]
MCYSKQDDDRHRPPRRESDFADFHQIIPPPPPPPPPIQHPISQIHRMFPPRPPSPPSPPHPLRRIGVVPGFTREFVAPTEYRYLPPGYRLDDEGWHFIGENDQDGSDDLTRLGFTVAFFNTSARITMRDRNRERLTQGLEPLPIPEAPYHSGRRGIRQLSPMGRLQRSHTLEVRNGLHLDGILYLWSRRQMTPDVVVIVQNDDMRLFLEDRMPENPFRIVIREARGSEEGLKMEKERRRKKGGRGRKRGKKGGRGKKGKKKGKKGRRGKKIGRKGKGKRGRWGGWWN